MYSAFYLPRLMEGEENPSRAGFATMEEAYEYVFSRMCDTCIEERRMALAGEKYPEESEFPPDPFPEFPPDPFPACASEWIVGLTSEFESAKNFDELMIAGGYTIDMTL